MKCFLGMGRFQMASGLGGLFWAGICLAGLLLLPSACEESSPCSLIGAPPSPAIVVTVWDAATGDPLGDGVEVTALVDDEILPFNPSESNEFLLFGAAGVYEILVKAEGYLNWAATGVEVRRGRCDVITTPVHAKLTANHGSQVWASPGSNGSG